MTDEQKDWYKEQMKAKAVAYAEEKLSDVKMFMPKDEYQEAVIDFANAFLAGADAAIDMAKGFIKNKEK